MSPVLPPPIVPECDPELQADDDGFESDRPLLPRKAPGSPRGDYLAWSLPRLLITASSLGFLAICWCVSSGKGPHWDEVAKADLGTSVGFSNVPRPESKVKHWVAAAETYGNVHGFQVFKDSMDAYQALGDNHLNISQGKMDRLSSLVNNIDLESFNQQVQESQQAMLFDQGQQAQLLAARYHTLKALQASAPLETSQRLQQRALGSARRVVQALYTFGAPGTSKEYLYDASRPDGCFPGLRTYSTGARYTVGMDVYFEVRDPVSWLTSGLGLTHARMESMKLNDDDDKDQRNPLHPCTADADDPAIDNFWWVTGHLIYEDILRSHLDFSSATPKLWGLRTEAQGADKLREKMGTAYVMSHFSQMNYKTETPLLSIDSPDWGWTLVGRACSQKKKVGVFDRPDGELSQAFADGCKDHVTLYQHYETWQCAVLFEGSQDTLDWFANLDLSLEEFCGFGATHRGFKHKLLRMVQGIDYRQVILPKLGSCNGVVAAGHSLGAAQAELFAACANAGLEEGHVGYRDHRYMVPTQQAEAARLPPFFSDHGHGLFYQSKSTGLCLDVVGVIGSDPGTDVILFECELPSGNWSMEQRWRKTDEGLLVNRFSGLCLTLFMGAHKTAVRMWTCSFQSSHIDQHWDVTHEKFLKSRKYGLCLNSDLRMYTCPHTDQQWSMSTAGYLVSRLSGKCLDVRGGLAREGAPVVLWNCEPQNGTDQRWDFTNLGALRNRLSGLCLNVVNQEGRENKPSLALAVCRPEVRGADVLWDFTPEGFLKDRRSGKCLDVEGTPGIEGGSPIRLARCEDVHVQTPGRWKLMEEGFLRNIGSDYGHQHHCLEVEGKTPQQRKALRGKLTLKACKANTDQKWELTSAGFLKNAVGGRKCLDVKPREARANDASHLWLQNCEEPSDPSQFRDQKWERLPNGRLRNFLSFACPEQVGLMLHMRHCESGGTWVLSSAGRLTDPTGEACATAVQSSPGVTRLDVQSCATGIPGQIWHLTAEGFLKSRHGCLASVQQLAPAPPLAQLQACPETEQRWHFLANGLLQNMRSNACLEAGQLSGDNSLATLSTAACHPERTSMQWQRLAK